MYYESRCKYKWEWETKEQHDDECPCKHPEWKEEEEMLSGLVEIPATLLPI